MATAWRASPNVSPDYALVGIEQNEKLGELATRQVSPFRNASIVRGDIRDRSTIQIEDASVDVAICQRVLINILNRLDQARAVASLTSLLRPGGFVLFIEAFERGLFELNAAREELGLDPIRPSEHNLYLTDECLESRELSPACLEGWNARTNELSAHYYISCVLHAAFAKSVGWPAERNSRFVSFLSSALPGPVGNYSPLEIHAFSKRIG